MKLDLPGLMIEKMRSGTIRYRVIQESRPYKRIRLQVDPDHKEFLECYHAARAGISIKPEGTANEQGLQRTIKGSVAWLTYKHLEALEKLVEAGIFSPLTLKKREGLFKRLRKICGQYPMEMPTSEIIKIRDDLAAKPATADSMVEAMRSMFRWACERDYCDFNPAIGISTIDRSGGGAKAWTLDDLAKFRKRHPPGTTAYLALTLFMFTACRISDAIKLGLDDEFERGGVHAIGWQPKKKGSAYIEIPMLPPLINATRATAKSGSPYIISAYGKIYRTPDALGQRFRKWCDQAGLYNLSSHGIRKAAGHLLAQAGCSQYQIMAIHGHTQAKTSEVYTKGVERWSLSTDAMASLNRIEW